MVLERKLPDRFLLFPLEFCTKAHQNILLLRLETEETGFAGERVGQHIIGADSGYPTQDIAPAPRRQDGAGLQIEISTCGWP